VLLQVALVLGVFDDGSIEHQTGAGTKWYRNFAELERSLRASIGVSIGNGDGHGGDARVTAPTTPIEEVPVNPIVREAADP
jgi:hypothetical protein